MPFQLIPFFLPPQQNLALSSICTCVRVCQDGCAASQGQIADAKFRQTLKRIQKERAHPHEEQVILA